MITNGILQELQERYGIGITISDNNQGGFIVDSSGKVKETTLDLIQNDCTTHQYSINPTPVHLQNFSSSYYKYDNMLLLVA